MTEYMKIERTLSAPADKVYDMFADGEMFKTWYGPMGATLPVCNVDSAVGGKRHICMEMHTPNGEMKMWFVGKTLEANKPNKLVYTEAMSDEEGNVMDPAAMGMPEGAPADTKVIVDLTQDGDTTLLKLEHSGIPVGSPGEMGWNMALDKLVEVLG